MSSPPANLPSIFLSHQSAQRELVCAVARQLGRYGVVPWVHDQGSVPGEDLHRSLPEAIRACRMTAAFLSEKAVQSDWVKDELAVALRVEDQEIHRVVPVFLGDPLALVRGHRPLERRWVHTERDQITRLGVMAPEQDPVAIARALAQAAFDRLSWPPATSPGVVIDQRGEDGQRIRWLPKTTVHERFLRGEGPVLVFRPDDGERTKYETLVGDAWRSWWADVQWGLGQLRKRAPEGLHTLRIAGAGQLGMGWALGRALDRTSRVELSCFPRQNGPGEMLTNRGQEFAFPLEGGSAACTSTHSELGFLPLPEGPLPEIDLVLASNNPRYLTSVRAFREYEAAQGAAVWVPTGMINDSTQAMALVRDVVALLLELSGSRGTVHTRVFTTLPFHLLPLLSSNLTHVMQRLTFMEYHRAQADGGAGASDTYAPLDI